MYMFRFDVRKFLGKSDLMLKTLPILNNEVPNWMFKKEMYLLCTITFYITFICKTEF